MAQLIGWSDIHELPPFSSDVEFAQNAAFRFLGIRDKLDPAEICNVLLMQSSARLTQVRNGNHIADGAEAG